MAERLPRPAVVAAWSSAVFVAGGFGLVAGVPIAVTAVSVFRADRLRPLRPWVTALGTGYLTLVLVWRTNEVPGPSLTQSMSLPVTAALAALGAGTALAYHVLSYRRRRN